MCVYVVSSCVLSARGLNGPRFTLADVINDGEGDTGHQHDVSPGNNSAVCVQIEGQQPEL